ncbi:MAG: hypothetical protein R2791_05585 [Saprospiraceae bacterium]
MQNNILKLCLLLIASTLAFPFCTKNNTDQSVDDLVDQTLYEAQERGGIGKYGCYELVFPVTLEFPDSTTQEVNSYDEMKDALQAWFLANGSSGHPHHGHATPRPTIAFPFSVISQDGELITINNETELHDLKAACGGGTFGHHGHHGHGQHGLACFEIQFPITIQFPDGTTETVADQQALHTLLHDWKNSNPAPGDHPEIVFPINVVMKDDGTVVTVNSKDELHDLKENCD